MDQLTEIYLKDILKQLSSLNSRLSWLEGAFVERGKWEDRLYNMQKTVTEEKSNV